MFFDQKYFDLLYRSYLFFRSQFREVSPELAYYGTGEAAHWPVQSNFNVAFALAVLASSPQLDSAEKSEMREWALKLFRYGVATHKTGNTTATCGQQWGGSWITVLGLERGVAGQLELEKYFTDSDRENFRKLRLFEADWLLKELPVVAHVDNSTKMNKPESNCWNGSFLYRAAMDYPDAPNAGAYRQKAIEFLLNSVSHPQDADSETLYENQPLRLWHRGFNFTENYSLDHHGYMNVGYGVVTLSHVAYLHFYCKSRNYPVPEAAYLHLQDYWKILKTFIFPDGRLLRIGGDTRARYCYCQMYLLPVLHLVADVLKDEDSVFLEKGMLELLEEEQQYNADGSFFGSRLFDLQFTSPYYYTRLESDPFAALAAGMFCRNNFDLPQLPDLPQQIIETQWKDDFHTANFIRTAHTARSAVRKGSEGPMLLACPLDDSSMAEWQGNGFSWFNTHRCKVTGIKGSQQDFPGGFVNTGENSWFEFWPWGEGEGQYTLIRTRSVCAALDDGKTMIVMEYSCVVKECHLASFTVAGWKLPNDRHNKLSRTFKGENFSCTLQSHDGRGVIDTRSKWLNADDKFSLILAYGSDSWKIHAPNHSMGGIYGGFCGMNTLYINELCMDYHADNSVIHFPGEVLCDSAYAVIAGVTATETPQYALEQIPTDGMLRAVYCTLPSGVRHLIVANFGDAPAIFEGMEIPALNCISKNLCD